MKRVDELILKSKNVLLLLVFGASIIYGIRLNELTVNLFYGYYEDLLFDNKEIIKYIGLGVNILTIILPTYILVVFLIIPAENRIKRKIKIEYEIGFKTFMESLTAISETKMVKNFAFDYNIFLEFHYDKYRIEVSELANRKIIKLHWFSNVTGDFVNERFINYKAESTVSIALENGPWYDGQKINGG